MLKGRQTGGMHRGHTWIFRAESHDTMMAWYADIKELTEKSGKERDAFVRRTHARSLSGGSMKAHSIGSADSGLEEDEADAQPYSSEQSVRGAPGPATAEGQDPDLQYGADTSAADGLYKYGEGQTDAAGWRNQSRPSPGGRFPSELNVQRGLQAPLSPSSGESSSERDRDAIAAAGALPGSGIPFARQDSIQPGQQSGRDVLIHSQGQTSHHQDPLIHHQAQTRTAPSSSNKTDITNLTGLGVLAAGAGTFYDHRKSSPPPPETVQSEMDNASAIPAAGTSSAPIVATSSPTTLAQVTSTSDSTRPTSSSHDDAGSLSTIPTTVSTSTHPDPATMAALVAAGAAPQVSVPVEASTQGTKTVPLAQAQDQSQVVEGAAERPKKPENLRTLTSGTISDLHIPGQFPKTPKAV